MEGIMLFEKVDSKNEECFNQYVELAENFSKFLNEHGNIAAIAMSDIQRNIVVNAFNRLSAAVQIKKYDNLFAFYELCREIVNKGQSLRDKKNFLRAFLMKYGLSVPDEEDIFAAIDKDSYIEVYDNLFTQVFRSTDFFNVTSHSVMALEVCEWFDLFQRSKDLTKDQVEVVTKIFSGSIKVPIFKPIENHSVKEINSDKPRNSLAEIVLYSPIFNADGEFHGILHIFKVIESKSLEFHLV
jgi:hypothetical protein